MGKPTIDHLIINSPYEEPKLHWSYDRESRTFDRKEGRRPAGYVIASQTSKAFDDPGIFVPIPLVNQIRPRVEAWREAGYPGATGITKRLLEHWHNPEERENRLFFCQLEAIETLIWLTEAPASEKVGIDIPSDGGSFSRLCSKMATGSGKTVVMAMLIAWQVINKVTYPQDARFSKHVFVVAPGLTVKSRLQVLYPAGTVNFYDEFIIVPPALLDKLRQGRVLIPVCVRTRTGRRNWHGLNWETEDKLARKKTVDKRGAKSDEAYVREVLGEIATARSLVVINDEAHHAWRIPAESKVKGVKKEEVEHAKDDLNRKAKEQEPLPQLVSVGYYLLGRDWLEAAKAWKERKLRTPPVMITVASRTETAARVNYAFTRKRILIDELCDPEKILHIDSKVLEMAEAEEEPVSLNDDNPPEPAWLADRSEEEAEGDEPTRKLTKKEQGELLRRKVDTIGQVGKPGEAVQKVISVGMLSEGWDARTVTHIMGLRAFTSQLLCEQVVGRGLRRVSYEINKETGLFDPEYVNIFGVPFTFLPHEADTEGLPPPPPPPKTKIEPVIEKKEFEISWPNIIRIDHVFRPELRLDLNKTRPLELNAYETPTLVHMAPIIDGKPDVTKISAIDLEELGKKFRWQKIVFEQASQVYDQMRPRWKGNKEYLLAQLIRLVEQFVSSGKIEINPPLFNEDDLRRRILITLNMSKAVQHMWENIISDNTESRAPIFDTERPILSTGEMRIWFTGKPCEYTERSHINFCVYDSTWEATEAFELDRNPNVAAWVKNDHLGFEVLYIYQGVVHKYRPDFLIRLKNGTMLVLETKGQESDQDKTKRASLDEWVKAVNEQGEFGMWRWAVSESPGDLKEILHRSDKPSSG